MQCMVWDMSSDWYEICQVNGMGYGKSEMYGICQANGMRYVK